jgi:hypothetical protein
MAGPVAEVVAGYLKEGQANTGEQVWPDGPHAPGDEIVRLRRARVASAQGKTAASINIGEDFTIEFAYDVAIGGMVLFPAIRIFNEWGTEVLWTTDSTSPQHGNPREPGRYHSIVHFPRNLLSEGLMAVSISITSLCPTRVHFSEPDAIHFQAMEVIDGNTSRGEYTEAINSMLRPLLDWSVRREGVC